MKNIAVVYAFVSLFLIVWCGIHNDPQGVLCFMMSFTSLAIAYYINHKADNTEQTLYELIDVVQNLAKIMHDWLEHEGEKIRKELEELEHEENY